MGKNAIFHRDFILVAIGQIISIFGNQILRYALPLYLLNRTGSSVLFGTVLAISFVPMLLLYPIGGIIADRVNKRNIMVILDFSTALLVFLFYLLVGKIDIVPLIAIAMIVLYSIQGAYQPAVQASIPVLVETEHIMQGNSVINLITSLASMVGPVIGGVLFSIVGLTPILYVSIGCFFASAVMEIFIRIPFEKKEATGNMFVTGWGDLKESFSFMFNERPVLWKMSLIYASINLFLTSLTLIGVPVLITQHLGFEPNTANRLYGYAQGVIAAGAVLGGLLAGALAKKLNSRASPFLLSGCALSVLMGGIALHLLRGSMEIYIVLVIGCGLLVALSTVFQIQIMANLQILTPGHLTGKVIACVICACMCTIPVGQFMYGLVFESIGSRAYLPFYASGLIMTGIAVFTRRIFREIDQLIEKRAPGDD
ncbi:MFS transporter [Leadbettera azotonutricia]|uniref:Macrolide-efflux protein n=1 Tax=Leadbettera azotonutricia (strain ATCC BAA-888 / DSM 13862 / ZAS-9) TaxID=545695 RepID=F5YGE4_LEAAZ|nr:MFS transporter [Leadbettera azotonutricia]AEF80118.1 macrolide-efflux protein [Leadbettera azotonutricia ZAS-9]